MDYYHNHRPHAPTYRDSNAGDREGRSGHSSKYSSHLGVVLDNDRHHRTSTPRSSSYTSPRPPREHGSRRSRSQVRWPPPPFVESERASLSREYRARRCGEPDPPFRGTVDQDPLMVEVNPPKRPPPPRSSLKAGSPATASSRRRGKSPAPPPIKTNLDTLPDFVERQPRPYNGTATADPASKRISTAFLLSPQRMTPTRSASFEADNVLSGGHLRKGNSPGVSPVRSPGTYPPPPRSGRNGTYTTDESDLEARDIVQLRNRTRSNRYSFTKAELSNQTTRKSNLPDSSDESLSERASKLRDSTYRSSQGSSRGSRPTTPNLDNARQTTQPPRTPPASALSYKQTAKSTPASSSGRISRPSYASSSNPSQASQSRYPYSPPHSPKLRPVPGAASPLHAGSRTGSRTASRAESRQNSRPTTPSSMLSDAVPSFALFEAVNQKLQSPATFPPTQDTRSRNASRLSSAMRADSIPTSSGPRIDVQSPSPQPPAKVPLPYPNINVPKLPYPSLPYPDQQSPFMMPSEATFQFQHPDLPSEPSHGPIPPTRVEHTRTATLQRPTLVQRHSCAEGMEQTKNDRLSSPLSPTKPSRTATFESVTALAPAPPASCPRSKSSKGNNDWSTLIDDPTFNICPSCLHSTVQATAFYASFQPVQREATQRIKCDFSRPWIRLAWLLTLKQQRPDLDLLYAVSSVSNIESECPADEEQKRSWYGIFGDDDEPVPDFYMCSRDRRYVEALFPSLKKFIDRVSRSAHTCTLDRGSTQFGAFLDQLVEIDEKARRSKRAPDFHAFQELVQKNTIINNMPKCPKDTMAKGSEWHYLPGLLEFTVCPRCFVECVAPHIRTSTRASPVVASLPLADQFYRTAQPLTREHGITRGMGSSCQLYSARMRRIWANAVEDNDEKYLAKRVRERKAVEMSVYETYAALEKMTAAPGYDKAIVKEELDRVHKDWKEVE